MWATKNGEEICFLIEKDKSLMSGQFRLEFSH